MRIIFVGKHGSGGNDDEGAVASALRELGHEVVCVQERQGHGVGHKHAGHFCLFFKWDDVEALQKLPMRKVCWYFDLVNFPDVTLSGRCRTRMEWMLRTTPLVDLMFCTDGDWVDLDRTGKLVTLRQGFDSRVTSVEPTCDLCSGPYSPTDILFTGLRDRCGAKRESFVDEMVTKYGPQFRWVKRGVHGASMAGLVKASKIVVAPDGPVTDRYWSNRVYNALGFGAFLLHPYCRELAREYEDDKELTFYHDRKELHRLIERWLHPEIANWQREEIGQAGRKRTVDQHTYRHRCAELIRVVKEKLF